MLYKSFRIQNYKAIKDLEIELDEQRLTPIIGLNETGKSTILQAIFAFDYYNDTQDKNKRPKPCFQTTH